MNYCKITPIQINTFIRRCFESSVKIRSLVIYQEDELLADISIPPYHSSDIQQVYSISKSFTTTAIGLLYDQGLIHLEGRVIDLFPEETLDNPCKNLHKLKVKHLLSMNTGHELDTTSRIISASNPISAFLALPIEYEPGTHFTYNTGATYILSALVSKITGKTLHDFLTEQLFHQLDIKNTHWGCDQSGINLGGFDLHISNHDINKLGRLYLNQGVYNGVQIISSEWVTLATNKVSDTSLYDYTVDWLAGYGFQFWMNETAGFRADGAYGQICLVDPNKKIVFSVLSETNNMQHELTAMKELIDDIKVGPAHQDIKLDYYQPLSSQEGSFFFGQKLKIKLEKNQWDLQHVNSIRFGQNITLTWSYEGGVFELSAGDGLFIYNHFLAPRLVRKLFFGSIFPVEKQSCYASYMESQHHILIQIRYTNLPHTHLVTITKDFDKFDIEWVSSFNFYGNDKTHIKGELSHE